MVNPDGTYSYVNDWINYHSDFLTGTTSKILRYSEPLYYERLFQHFEKNLRESERLVIIGYGSSDKEINEIIKRNFNFRANSVFIVDPFPSDRILYFAKEINATVIEKTPDNIDLGDFK